MNSDSYEEEENIVLFTGMGRNAIKMDENEGLIRTAMKGPCAREVYRDLVTHYGDQRVAVAFEIMIDFLCEKNKDWLDEFLGVNEYLYENLGETILQIKLYSLFELIAQYPYDQDNESLSVLKDFMCGDVYDDLLVYDKTKAYYDTVSYPSLDPNQPYKIVLENENKPLFTGMKK